MNIYDQITVNNRKAVIIQCAFPIALFVLVLLFSYLLAWTDILSYIKRGVNVYRLALDFNPEELMRVESLEDYYSGLLSPYLNQTKHLTLSIYPVMIIAAFIWIVISYRKGDVMLLNMARAHPIKLEDNRELFRLVENTAIMAGLPMPRIYLMKDESMNAFATGLKPEQASIALTDGIIKNLDKAELQAVIAHELGHIGNRDTRLMLITVAGIGCFTFFSERLFRNARDGSGLFSIFYFLGSICYLFGYVVAPILRFALSRRLEFQADATAVKITRDSESLARALFKIAEKPGVSGLFGCHLFGNMCIANPTKIGFMSRLYSTHPPLEERIAVLRKMNIKGRPLFDSMD